MQAFNFIDSKSAVMHSYCTDDTCTVDYCLYCLFILLQVNNNTKKVNILFDLYLYAIK